MFIKTVSQFPKKNSVKAFRGIVKLPPDLTNRFSSAKTLDKSEKHVTDIELFDPLGEKHDVLMAHRPNIQYSPFVLTIDAFCEELKGIAGIAGRSGFIF